MHRKHNATKNCDLSENNLKCGQTLNNGEKKHLKNINLHYKTKMNIKEIKKPCKVPIEYKIILKGCVCYIFASLFFKFKREHL